MVFILFPEIKIDKLGNVDRYCLSAPKGRYSGE